MTDQLMLFRGTAAVCWDKHMEHAKEVAVHRFVHLLNYSYEPG
jgi:hypothetical protein